MLRMHRFILLQGALHVSASLFLINGSENKIHLFQGPALGFLQEYNDKHTHGQTEDAKHEECPPANCINGPGSDLCNDEIKEPLSACSEADTIRTKTGREDLKSESVSETGFTKASEYKGFRESHTSLKYTQGVGPQEKEYPITYR